MKHRHKPMCEACGSAPAELRPDGRGWKRRCSECQRAVELQSDRERMARRRLRDRGRRIEPPCTFRPGELPEASPSLTSDDG
jgi:hypothetical protein